MTAKFDEDCQNNREKGSFFFKGAITARQSGISSAAVADVFLRLKS
jgi:hypothetical protein